MNVRPVYRVALLGSVLLASVALAFDPPIKKRLAAVADTDAAKAVVLEFAGPIDGSELIEITAAGAVWKHQHWDLPSAPMMVNGIAWSPREINPLPNRGETRFLPGPVDFRLAVLEIIEGRDIIAMNPTKDRVVIYLNDTPNGESHYRFRITFDPAKAVKPPPAPTLRLRARIDGSDVLHITKEGAVWEHKHWDWPGKVVLNKTEWSPKENPTLANSGETRFLPANIDFSTAKATQKSGRDVAFVVPDEKGLTIYFADGPNGADDYDVVITFSATRDGY